MAFYTLTLDKSLSCLQPLRYILGQRIVVYSTCYCANIADTVISILVKYLFVKIKLDISLRGNDMLERILKLIEHSGLSDAAICKKLSIGNGSIGKWRSGKQKPSLDAVVKIAGFFQVSLDYLITGTDPCSSIYSEEDAEWISLIHKLPREKQIEFRGELIGYLKALQDIQEKKEAFQPKTYEKETFFP